MKFKIKIVIRIRVFVFIYPWFRVFVISWFRLAKPNPFIRGSFQRIHFLTI